MWLVVSENLVRYGHIFLTKAKLTAISFKNVIQLNMTIQTDLKVSISIDILIYIRWYVNANVKISICRG